MAIEGFQDIQLDGIFSKGVILDKGDYTMGVEYSPDAKDIRLVNGVTIGRKGTVTKIKHGSGTNIKGMVVANGQLYVAVNSKIMKANFTTNTLVDIAVSGGGPASYGADTDVEFVQFGPKLIVLTGSGFPYVYDTVADSWIQTSVSHIVSGADPHMGVEFSRMTIVLGNGAGYKDKAFLSRGIIPTNPEYAYTWTGTGSEQLIFNSNHITAIATLSRVYIFTEKTVEQFTQDTLTQIGGVSASYTIPVSKNNQPAGKRAVVAADDKVFYFSRNKKVKSIDYVQDVTDPKIGDVSDRQNQSIRKYLDALDDDQSKCIAIYNSVEKTVEFHLKTKGSPVNNTTLVYDIINDTFLVDSNKFYSCWAELDSKIYAGSGLNTSVINDNTGYDDDGWNIPRYRKTKPLHFGNKNIRKKFAGIGICGEISPNSEMEVVVMVDGKTVYRTAIIGQSSAIGGLGSGPLGSMPTGGESVDFDVKPFEYYIPKGKLYEKGKYLEVLFAGKTKGMQFSLSTINVDVKGLGDVELDEKI